MRIVAIRTKSMIGSPRKAQAKSLGLTKLHTLRTYPQDSSVIGAIRTLKKEVAWTITDHPLPSSIHLCPPKGGFSKKVPRVGFIHPDTFKLQLLGRYRL